MESAVYGTNLGWFNNRAKQLKKLAKGTAARLSQQFAQEHSASSIASSATQSITGNSAVPSSSATGIGLSSKSGITSSAKTGKDK